MLWAKFGKSLRDLWSGGQKLLCTGTLEKFGNSNTVFHFINLEFSWNTYWVLRDYEEGGKVNKRQAVEQLQMQIEGRELAPLKSLKDQLKSESTEKLVWQFKLDL